jgi:hypothetical protein
VQIKSLIVVINLAMVTLKSSSPQNRNRTYYFHYFQLARVPVTWFCGSLKFVSSVSCLLILLHHPYRPYYTFLIVFLSKQLFLGMTYCRVIGKLFSDGTFLRKKTICHVSDSLINYIVLRPNTLKL